MATINGTSASEDLIGTSGDDVFNDSAGNDTLRGLQGDDRFLFDAGFTQSTIFGGAGTDLLTFDHNGGFTTIDLEIELSGGDFSGVVFDGLGQERVAFDELENITSGRGDDEIVGGVDHTWGFINAGRGDDSFTLGNGTFSGLLGGLGADVVTLTATTVTGNVSLGGREGISSSGDVGLTNTLDLSGGVTISGSIFGSQGTDLIDISNATVGAIFTGPAGTNDNLTITDSTVNGRITGQNADLTNTTVNGRITAVSSGADSSNVTLTDTTVNFIDGGNGNDSITLIGNSQITNAPGISVRLRGGDDTLDLSQLTTQLTSTLASDFQLGAGADTFRGSVFDDAVQGGAGNDSLDGAGGNDTLDGGGGRDTLQGGSGANQVTGGAGDDLFIYTAGETLSITDFGAGSTDADDGDNTNNDFIDLSAFYTDVQEFRLDLADNGILDQSDGDYSDNTSLGGGQITGLSALATASQSSIFEQTGVPCFTPGTLIVTAEGEKPIETIRVGDLVLTVDEGLQPVRWIGCRDVTATMLERAPELKPIVIRKGAFGNARKMVVSPQHGFLVDTAEGQRLIRAKHAAETWGGQIARKDKHCRGVRYIHMMFDRHQMVVSNGAKSESFYPGPMALRSVGQHAALELFRLFPALADVIDRRIGVQEGYGDPTRGYLKKRDLGSERPRHNSGCDLR